MTAWEKSWLRKPFEWKGKRPAVAEDLALGMRTKGVAEKYKLSTRTITRWKRHPDFAAEVDRLTLIVGIASKAARLRIANRAVQQLVTDAGVKTSADVLAWLKFAQAETDGIKLDLTALLDEILAMAGTGPEGTDTTGTDEEGSTEATP